MLTLGIDLAARPRTTATCLLDWSEGVPVVTESTLDVDDDQIAELATRADLVGIDCPFGWPEAFVETVSAHHRHDPLPRGPDSEALRLRRTDLEVRDVIGRAPLSVSTDLIGVVALRCARLLETIYGSGLDRSGAAGVAETYPGGALTCWGIDHRGYKRAGPEAAARRVEIAAALRRGLGVDVGIPVRTDHHLDAFICALLARAVGLGLTTAAPKELRATARREGWIHLPTGLPAALVRPNPGR